VLVLVLVLATRIRSVPIV